MLFEEVTQSWRDKKYKYRLLATKYIKYKQIQVTRNEIQKYRLPACGATRSSRLQLFILLQLPRDVRLDPQNHHHCHSDCNHHHDHNHYHNDNFCHHDRHCRETTILTSGNGRQGLLRDPQAGSIHHRHQRPDGRTGNTQLIFIIIERRRSRQT